MSRTSRPPIEWPDAGRVGVEQRRDLEAADGEAGVAGQRLTEVADADQRDRAVHGEPEGAGDLLGQGRDVVADAADAVRAEVGQVLAQLRGVDAGRGGQFLGGHRGHRPLGERAQHAQVGGQPRDGRFGHRRVRVRAIRATRRSISATPASSAESGLRRASRGADMRHLGPGGTAPIRSGHRRDRWRNDVEPVW